MRFRERMTRFMQGRYGTDALSKFLLGVVFGLLILSVFTRGVLHSVLYWMSLAGLVYSYLRMFSRNYNKRYAENQWFLQKSAKFRWWLSNEKKMMTQRKTHHIYRCPSCRQKIRIPRGKGKIEICCPKCRTRFIKRS